MAFPIPEIGVPNALAAPQINHALAMLDRQVSMALGSSTSRLVGAMSDSIGGYILGGQGNDINFPSHSPFFWAQAQHFHADLTIDNVEASKGGYGFVAPGQTSAWILANMVPAFEAKIAGGARVPDIMIVSSGQNDGVTDIGKALATFANIKETVERTQAPGVSDIILFGLLPYPGIASPARPWALDYCNEMLRAFARATPGVHFLNCLPLVKDVSGAPEALPNKEVRWRTGTNVAGETIVNAGRGGTSIDNPHPALGFGYIMGKPLADILRRIAPEKPYPDIAAVDYDAAQNPLGSVLGTRGLFMGGSSGLAAGWSITNVDGVVATPSLSVGADGFIRQRITLSGMPTVKGFVSLDTRINFTVPGGGYEFFGIVDCGELDGASGPVIYAPRMGLGTAEVDHLAYMHKGKFSGRMVLSSPRASYFNGPSALPFGTAVGVVPGVPVSGYWEVSRFAFIKVL